LPFDPALVNPGENIGAYIYNEVTGAYDTVHPVPGAAPPRIDRKNALVTFDVQVLGNFVLAVER